MSLREVIDKLEELEAEVGDVEVECRNPAGDFDRVGTVIAYKRVQEDMVVFIGAEFDEEEQIHCILR